MSGVQIRGIMHLKYHDSERHKTAAPTDLVVDGAPEVEITPAMIEAGLSHLLRFHRDRQDDEEVVRLIFRAMISARASNSSAH